MRRIIESTFVSLDRLIGDPRARAMQYFDNDFQHGALQELLASDAMGISGNGRGRPSWPERHIYGLFERPNRP